jgi:hypothetical protein
MRVPHACAEPAEVQAQGGTMHVPHACATTRRGNASLSAMYAFSMLIIHQGRCIPFFMQPVFVCLCL